MQTTTPGPINARFVQARRRAARLERPHLIYPAYARRSLTPRVEIGCMRDPAQPIKIQPAIHTPPPKRLGAKYWAMWGSCACALVVVVSLLTTGY